MKKEGSLGIAILFSLLGLFGIVQSLTFGYWESIVLPLVISSLVFILAAVEVGKEIRHQDDTKTAIGQKSGTRIKNGFEIRRLGLVFGWVAGFSLAIYLLGFHIAIPLFSFAYLKWRRRSWLAAAVFAIAALAFSYAVFVTGLKIPLYKGLIFGAH
jgi:hypothetical protein